MRGRDEGPERADVAEASEALAAEDVALGRLERRLVRQISRTNKAWKLIEPDDRVMVAISGGKDSWSLLHLLRAYRRRLPFDFSIVAVNLDQGQPGFRPEVLREHLERHGFEYHLVHQDTYSVVKANVPAGKAYCSLCSRLRRGILYDVATKLGATKIALGHHRDDVVETLMLNLLYAGQLKAMPCRLRSDDGRNTIIRPLAFCAEVDVGEYAARRRFPILPCDLCGSQDNLKRKRVKALLAEMAAEDPRIPANVMAALSNIKPSHLYDPELATGGRAGPVRVEDATGRDGGSAEAVSSPPQQLIALGRLAPRR